MMMVGQTGARTMLGRDSCCKKGLPKETTKARKLARAGASADRKTVLHHEWAQRGRHTRHTVERRRTKEDVTSVMMVMSVDAHVT